MPEKICASVCAGRLADPTLLERSSGEYIARAYDGGMDSMYKCVKDETMVAGTDRGGTESD